jgi:hypothetical protein
MKTNIHFLSSLSLSQSLCLSLSQFFSEWEMFQTNVLEKIKRHILHVGLVIFFFFEKHAVCKKKVGKYRRKGQAKVENMAHAYFALCSLGNKNRFSEYIVLIVLPLQQCLHERASALHVCLNCISCWELQSLPWIRPYGCHLCSCVVKSYKNHLSGTHSLILFLLLHTFPKRYHYDYRVKLSTGMKLYTITDLDFNGSVTINNYQQHSRKHTSGLCACSNTFWAVICKILWAAVWMFLHNFYPLEVRVSYRIMQFPCCSMLMIRKR